MRSAKDAIVYLPAMVAAFWLCAYPPFANVQRGNVTVRYDSIWSMAAGGADISVFGTLIMLAVVALAVAAMLSQVRTRAVPHRDVSTGPRA